MRFLLVLLVVATSKCINGRRHLVHHQSLNSDIKDERNSSPSLLNKTSLSETSDSEAVESNGHVKSSINTKIESQNQIYAFLTALHKLTLKRKDSHTDDLVGKLAQLINKANLKSKKIMPTQKLSIFSSNKDSPVRSVTSTTTLDPWDEFCKEACEEGLAGPECDCPEHPIG